MSKRLAVVLTLFLLISSVVEGKRVCKPTFRTKVLVAGGAFAGTYVGTMIAVPAALGMARELYTSLGAPVSPYVVANN